MYKIRRLEISNIKTLQRYCWKRSQIFELARRNTFKNQEICKQTVWYCSCHILGSTVAFHIEVHFLFGRREAKENKKTKKPFWNDGSLWINRFHM